MSTAPYKPLELKLPGGFSDSNKTPQINQISLAIVKQLVNTQGHVQSDIDPLNFIIKTRAYKLNASFALKKELRKEMKFIKRTKKNRILDEYAKKHRYVAPRRTREVVDFDCGWGDTNDTVAQTPVTSKSDEKPQFTEEEFPRLRYSPLRYYNTPLRDCSYAGSEVGSIQQYDEEDVEDKADSISVHTIFEEEKYYPPSDDDFNENFDTPTSKVVSDEPNSYEIAKRDLTCKFTLCLRKTQLDFDFAEPAEKQNSTKAITIIVQSLKDHAFVDQIVELFIAIGERVCMILDFPVVLCFGKEECEFGPRWKRFLLDDELLAGYIFPEGDENEESLEYLVERNLKFQDVYASEAY